MSEKTGGTIKNGRLATFGTQDKGRRPTKHKTQKDEQHEPHQTTAGELRCLRINVLLSQICLKTISV